MTAFCFYFMSYATTYSDKISSFTTVEALFKEQYLCHFAWSLGDIPTIRNARFFSLRTGQMQVGTQSSQLRGRDVE